MSVPCPTRRHCFPTSLRRSTSPSYPPTRLLGQDGLALQEHTYSLNDMTAPSAQDVRTALAAVQKQARDLSACQAY